MQLINGRALCGKTVERSLDDHLLQVHLFVYSYVRVTVCLFKVYKYYSIVGVLA